MRSDNFLTVQAIVGSRLGNILHENVFGGIRFTDRVRECTSLAVSLVLGGCWGALLYKFARSFVIQQHDVQRKKEGGRVALTIKTQRH